jgi:hypothetical protein
MLYSNHTESTEIHHIIIQYKCIQKYLTSSTCILEENATLKVLNLTE